ncbi:MAG: hypothetical protein AB8B70_10090, partial [Prochlorococcus sp.]
IEMIVTSLRGFYYSMIAPTRDNYYNRGPDFFLHCLRIFKLQQLYSITLSLAALGRCRLGRPQSG